MRRWQFFVCAMIFMATACTAVAAERDHVIVPEDYFSLVYAGSPAMSPDAESVAWIQGGWIGPGAGRGSELWVTDLDSRSSRRLTFDLTRPHGPVWSSDGKWIYFGGRWDRGEEKPPFDGSHQVWRIRPDGTDLLAITRIEDGVDLFELTRDGKQLYYTVGQENHDDEWEDLKQK